MREELKIINIPLALILILMIFQGGCGDNQDYSKRIEQIEKKQEVLDKKIASIEERLYNFLRESRRQNVSESPKGIDKKETAIDYIKGIPSEFKFPEYSVTIKDFTCYKGIGNLAVYSGNVVAGRDVQVLALRTEFFDENGKTIGGHSFPVNVITANSPKRFENSDIIDGGFKKVIGLKLNVDFISFSDFSIKGKEAERPRF